MAILIRILIFIKIILFVSNAYSAENKIIFKISDKIFTSVDLENRKDYLNIEQNSIDNTSALQDLIAINLFKIEYEKIGSEIPLENINNFYNIIKENINKLDNAENRKKIFNRIEKKEILKNIELDYIRKIMVEKMLNRKRESIFKNENNNNIYNFKLEIFSIKKSQFKKKNVSNINFNFDNIEKIKKIFEKKEINYIFIEKNINNINNINSNLREAINLNMSTFKYSDDKNYYVGKIYKELKIIKNTKFSIIEISSDKIIDEKLLYCDNIRKLNKKKEYKIKKIDIEYNKLNKNLRKLLISIDDKVNFKNKSKEMYVILCNIKIDKDMLNEINIGESINYFADIIEKDFIKNLSFKYNLQILND